MNRDNMRLGLNSLKVKYKGYDVGILALTSDKKVAFSYDEVLAMKCPVVSCSVPAFAEV